MVQERRQAQQAEFCISKQDLSLMDQHTENLKVVEANVKARIKSDFSNLPFLSNSYVDISGTESSVSIRIALNGHMPSLHAKRINHFMFEQIDDIESHNYSDTERKANEALFRILEAQKTRQEDAISYGFCNFPKTRNISHLYVDRIFPEIVKKPKRQLEETIINAIARAQQAGQYGGDRITQGSGAIISEHYVDGKWIRLVSPTMKIKNKAGRDVGRIRGAFLEINAPEIPETMMTSMIGRKLGELAEVHPAIDDRKIGKINPKEYKGKNGLQIGIGIDFEKITEVL